jgi:hypothetical protein
MGKNRPDIPESSFFSDIFLRAVIVCRDTVEPVATCEEEHSIVLPWRKNQIKILESRISPQGVGYSSPVP